MKFQEVLEDNKAGFTKLPGTELKNATTGEVIYISPQDSKDIIRLMPNLEKFIHEPQIWNCDPIVKMAIIQFQFESIHPFCDGNGRTGRIINILYLILEKLQNLPILYLSRYIIQNKADYYKLLQEVREKSSWEQWILFMIKAVESASKETIELIIQIRELMMNYKHKLRENYKFYSQDLLNNLFKHLYTKIEFVVNDLNVSRITTVNYLNKLADDGLLKKEKIGTGNYYVNQPLFDLLVKR